MLGIDHLAPWDKQRFVELYNGGAAEIPAFGCYEIYDAERPDAAEALVLDGGRTVLFVRQPTADNVANFGINGALPLPASTYGGFGTQDYPTYAAYDTANAPAFGEEWGPQSGSCLIKKNNRGLVIYGDASGGLVRVHKTPTVGIYTTTLAVLGGSLSAMDWTAGTVFPATSTITTAAVTGTVYGMKLVAGFAGQYSYQTIESGATIINPLPFSFDNGSVVRVAYANGYWVVLGPASSQVGASFSGSGGSASSPLDLTWTSTGGGGLFVGGLAAAFGTTARITAPVSSNLNVFVEWSATLTTSEFTDNGAYAYVTAAISSSSGGVQDSAHISTIIEPPVAGNVALVGRVSGWFSKAVTQGEEFSVSLTALAPASTLVNMSATGAMRITPMLGSYHG